MILLLIGASLVCCALAQTPYPVTTINSTTGFAKSPNYPSAYPNGVQERWILAVPGAGQYISPQFTKFDVEGYAGVACTSYDYVLILDISAMPNLHSICDIRNTQLAPSYGLYCNNMNPAPTGRFVTLPTRAIIVEFCSDSLNTMNSGFQLFYLSTGIAPATPPPVTSTPVPVSTTPAPYTSCGGVINLSPGQVVNISSPNYPPGPYPQNSLCIWNVTAANSNIYMRSMFFDVEGYTTQCNYDYVRISYSSISSKYCNPAYSIFKHISGYNASVIFASDSRVQRIGFNLQLSSPIIPTPQPTVDPHCGMVYSLNSPGSTATITSPGWPNSYSNNARCTWNVTQSMLPQNYSINMFFQSFNTESGYDGLQVYAPGQEPVGFDGLQTNQSHYFSASQLYLVFSSDSSVTRPGFQIQFSLIPTPFTCPSGTFKCASANVCIPSSKRCDGTNDCADSSDENDPWCQMPQLCGTQTIKPNTYVPGTRIVNGTVAKPGSWPWQVSVHMRQSDGSLFQICGASLISPHWLICAAHCFYGDTGNPGQFVFKIGSWNKNVNEPPFEVDIGASGIWIHPQYNPGTSSNDISLIKLTHDVPFPFNNHTNGVCIPQPGYTVPGGTNCVVTGWGTTRSGGSTSPILRQVVVPVVPNSVCNDVNHYSGQIDGSMICAGLEQGGKDTCQGDSGGPLVCQDPNSKRWVLQGITSWGYGCAVAHRPGVYSRVSALTSFVYNTINEQD